MKQAIMIGAGNIGRGFIGAILSRSGYHVTFADVNMTLIDAINAEGRYTVHIQDRNPAAFTITNIDGISSAGPELAEALKTAECNACMKRIVAAPTAGSCGVLPAVLLPLARAGEADEEAICDALYVAAGFGQVIAARATLAGAEGGCQAEVGAASAMAAAALCHLKGGTPEQCAAAAAMALGNLLGLVCDPVAGLVEVPCIKRNVVGAVNAVSCANMALAGVDYAIPCDEVIDAMGRVGSLLSPDLRETGQGGLANTPAAREWCAAQEEE